MVSYEDIYRMETYEYPRETVREALHKPLLLKITQVLHPFK
jgi:hypothetical protein